MAAHADEQDFGDEGPAQSNSLFLVLTFVIGTLLSLGLFFYVRGSETRQLRIDLENLSSDRVR